jgi:hypothetical protein
VHSNEQIPQFDTAYRISDVEVTLRLEGLRITPKIRTLLYRYGAHEITVSHVLSNVKERYTRHSTL